MIIDILFFHCSFVDMLNIISTCWDILCVDMNVDKRCVDHSTIAGTLRNLKHEPFFAPVYSPTTISNYMIHWHWTSPGTSIHTGPIWDCCWHPSFFKLFLPFCTYMSALCMSTNQPLGITSRLMDLAESTNVNVNVNINVSNTDTDTKRSKSLFIGTESSIYLALW